MFHRNARTTFRARLLIVERHRAGWPQAHIAAAMGISRQCVAKWLTRYAGEGPAGLWDRSSRPHSMPRQTSPARERHVVAVRARERVGRDQVAAVTGVPARTVSRILIRHRVPRLAACDPITGQLIRASQISANTYERDRPGDLVHMDVKKLGKIPDGGGWRVLGRSASVAHRHKETPVGYDYVHSLVDDHSRLAYCEVLTDEKGTTCAGFLDRAVAYFAERGITRIERLITDNAWAYRKSLGEVCARHGIRQKFIRPHCSWQNGKVERLNRTLATEWAYRRVYLTNQARTDALAAWLEHYNTERSHTALGGHPPISRLASSTS